MSVPVGAFASKSRPITAVNWSSDSKTEKSSSPRKLAGNTSRPCLLITKGFTYHLLEARPAPTARPAWQRASAPAVAAPQLLLYPKCGKYALPRQDRLNDLWVVPGSKARRVWQGPPEGEYHCTWRPPAAGRLPGRSGPM